MAGERWAKVRVSTGILQQILTGEGFARCLSDAPDDLEVLGVQQPANCIGIYFYAVVRSNAFKKIPEGAEIPTIEPFTFTSERRQDGGQGDDNA